MTCKRVPMVCAEGHLGFRSPCQPCPGCEPPIDWQARAEKAEAERDEARRERDEARSEAAMVLSTEIFDGPE